jgi:hypothetical protein
VVGPLERELYGSIAGSALSRTPERTTLAYAQGEYALYRIDAE